MVEAMQFNSIESSDSLKEAKFMVPDFAVKSLWSDMGTAFTKLHVTDTHLHSFFKKGMGPKGLEPPYKGYFDEISRALVKDAKEKMPRPLAVTHTKNSDSSSSLDSIGIACKKIDSEDRTKRLQDLKAKSLLHLQDQNKKKVIAIKKAKANVE